MNYNKTQDKIAYFSMEIALSSDLSTYAGGLGILAGDFLKSAADLNLSLVGVSLLNKKGYFKQQIDMSGQQIEVPELIDISKLKKIPQTVKIEIGSNTVVVGVWEYLIDNKLPVYFLDTDFPENKKEYRILTQYLYGQDQVYRLKQEIILGRGGVKMLTALGYKIKKFHINEGHGILAALELLSEMKNISNSQKRKELSRQLVFTNHTTVKAGQDIFPIELMLACQPDFFNNCPDFSGRQEINLTELAIFFAGKINCVSKNHRNVLESEFKPAKISYITNGVHAASWVSPELVKLYDKYIPGWKLNNKLLKKINKIPVLEIYEAHRSAKKRLIDYVLRETNISLDVNIFTLVFARRFTSYKQPLLLFSDMTRLLDINRSWSIQIIYAGKAHPHDLEGKKMIKEIYRLKKQYAKQINIVFLANYEIALAKLLVAGADLWLNNPLPPNEACGTSGMKASLNGVPQLSSPDGWWLEAYKKNKNGWLIKNSQAGNLYQTLATDILPLYYLKSDKWKKIMRSTIVYNGPIYNSERMVKEYWKKSYNI